MKEEDRQNQRLKEAGEKPIFISKADLKKKELIAQYEGLKKEGRLDKYLKKKEKRNTIKEKKRVK